MEFKRTHMCGSLRIEDLGKEVVLMGWVAKKRNLGSLVFIDLRDKTGISQIVIREDDKDNYCLLYTSQMPMLLSILKD